MAGPLLIIGNTQAQDTTASPSHDPGECIVCPLAYGPLDVCGGYSDYDYNQYWLDDNSPPAPEAVPPADPELEVAQSLTDDSTDQAWESGYEDYYADYVFGDDSTTTNEEDVTLEETPAPVASIDAASETARTPEVPQVEETFEQYDEYGWYTEGTAADEDYFDSYDGYEPIASAEPDAAARDSAIPEESSIDYEAYEEEWFSYGSEADVEAERVVDQESDEAYEALSESADAEFSNEAWGDEEEWYREEYGYEATSDDEIAEPSVDLAEAESLETGYDEAYDAAMTTDWEATEPVADVLPVTPIAESPEADFDYYESYYDAYDDLYNFESTPAEPFETESSDAASEPEVHEQVQQAMASEPAWLTELVDRMLAPVWKSVDGIALKASILDRDSQPTIYVDECAQEWDCEAEYWAQPQAEQPSVVLQAADTLDGMASLLQNAAELLRGVASGRLAETAQTANSGSPR